MLKQSLQLIYKLLLVLLLIAASCLLLAYVTVAVARMGYPFELEWMEGGSLDHVRRVIAGLPLYIQPSLSFTPFIYTPLYYYVSALFSALLGVGFLPLRLLSFLSSLGSMIVLFLLVRSETKSWVYGVFSVGLFAGTFVVSGAWYDLARTDSLFLFLLLLSVYCMRSGNDTRAALIAGALMFLSFLAKQTALAAAIAMTLFGLVYLSKRARYAFGFVFFTLLVISTLIWNWTSGGWYAYYIFDLPNQHLLHKDMLFSILIDDLSKPFPVALIISIYYFARLLLLRRWREFVFYGLLCAGLGGASILSRMHAGGYINVLIPAYTALALGFGLGLKEILGVFGVTSDRKLVDLRQGWVAMLSILTLFACMAQFYLLYDNPRRHIPTSQDVQAGNDLVQRLRDIEGEVYIPYHSYLSEMAGEQSYAQGMALEDVFRSQDESIRDALKDEIRTAIENKRFAAIILDGEWRFVAEIDANYEYTADVFTEDYFWTFTGMKTRPAQLYLRRP